jgi:hypothetical protein
LVEAGMIAQRHFDDFVKCRWIDEFGFHK